MRSQLLYACTNCVARVTFEQLSPVEQLCAKCLKIGSCRYCRNDFETSKTDQTCCGRCEIYLKTYGQPTFCRHCKLNAAFGSEVCYRCKNANRKYGPPVGCDICAGSADNSGQMIDETLMHCAEQSSDMGMDQCDPYSYYVPMPGQEYGEQQHLMQIPSLSTLPPPKPVQSPLPVQASFSQLPAMPFQNLKVAQDIKNPYLFQPVKRPEGENCVKNKCTKGAESQQLF